MPEPGDDRFLSEEEEQEIVDAILEAEQNTSGEIRVHIEPSSPGDPYVRAQEIFYSLKMDNTQKSNGVLFYVAVADRVFAIYGDKGINARVPDNFWDEIKALLETHFKKGRFKSGLVEAILKAGNELKAHFPWKPGDVNELGNEISKG